MKSLGNRSLSQILYFFLRVIWWIEWMGAAALIMVILITAFLKQSISLNFPVTFSPVTFKTVPPISENMPPGVVHVVNGNFEMPMENNWENILLLLAAGLAACSVVILITYQLKLLFASLSKNQPFDALNVVRIRNTGFGLIGLSLLLSFSNILIYQLLMSRFSWDKEISLTYRFNIGYLAAGILLIIVAEIFKEGVTLKEETSLTI